MKLALPELPYKADDLEPHISKETVSFHYLKHHKGYVDKAIKLVKGTNFENLEVEKIIEETRSDVNAKKIFNATAQIWNHDLYWNSMKKEGGGRPSNSLEEQIKKDFSTFEDFCEKFKQCGLGEFGSGYVWLIYTQGQLKIVSDTDADIPVEKLEEAILNMDVWEHAYYIDYRNERGNYIDTFLDHLVNWDNASKRFNALK